MIPVDRHIQYLITRHDCVIIPGWGALIAHRIPARIDDNSSVLFPPSAIVVFNPSINHDDAMIATSIVRTVGCNLEIAKHEVEEFSAALHRQMEAEKSVTISRIGTFRLSPDNTILFDPDLNGIANAPYQGLQQIQLTPLPVEGEEETLVKEISLTRRTTIIGKRVIRAAASIAVLLGLGITLSTPISSTYYDGFDFAGLGFSPKSAASVPDESSEFVSLPDPAGAMIMIQIPDSAIASAAVVSQPKIEFTGDPRRPVAGHNYYLIVASLESRSKAESYLHRHSDQDFAMIEGNGHYRIYAASGTSIADAARVMGNESFRKAHPDAWVYRVR